MLAVSGEDGPPCQTRDPKGLFVRSLWMTVGLFSATLALAQTEPVREGSADGAKLRYEKLQKEVGDAILAWSNEQREAAKKAREGAKKGEAIPAMSMVPPYGKFLGDFQKAAADYAGHEDAVAFLVWITQYGFSDPAAVKKAAGTLLKDHIESAALVELAQSLPRLSSTLGRDGAKRVTQTLIDQSPHASVRGWAVFAQAAPTIEDPNVAVGSGDYATAKAELSRASRDSGDAVLIGRVKGLIAEREQLANGLVAPDIVGVDLDGVEFKLSDYAGKVVMLDFWGDW